MHWNEIEFEFRSEQNKKVDVIVNSITILDRMREKLDLYLVCVVDYGRRTRIE